MLCYKDKTFCQGDGCARFGTSCDQSLTPEVDALANFFGLPISRFTEPKKLKCYEEKDSNQ